MTKALSLLLAAAVALTVTPAIAKTSKHGKHKKHVIHVRQTAPAYRGTDKFPAGPLYYNGGTYLGDDPDPFIRSQIFRDLGAKFGGPD